MVWILLLATACAPDLAYVPVDESPFAGHWQTRAKNNSITTDLEIRHERQCSIRYIGIRGRYPKWQPLDCKLLVNGDLHFFAWLEGPDGRHLYVTLQRPLPGDHTMKGFVSGQVVYRFERAVPQ